MKELTFLVKMVFIISLGYWFGTENGASQYNVCLATLQLFYKVCEMPCGPGERKIRQVIYLSKSNCSENL